MIEPEISWAHDEPEIPTIAMAADAMTRHATQLAFLVPPKVDEQHPNTFRMRVLWSGQRRRKGFAM